MTAAGSSCGAAAVGPQEAARGLLAAVGVAEGAAPVLLCPQAVVEEAENELVVEGNEQELQAAFTRMCVAKEKLRQAIKGSAEAHDVLALYQAARDEAIGEDEAVMLWEAVEGLYGAVSPRPGFAAGSGSESQEDFERGLQKAIARILENEYELRKVLVGIEGAPVALAEYQEARDVMIDWVAASEDGFL